MTRRALIVLCSFVACSAWKAHDHRDTPPADATYTLAVPRGMRHVELTPLKMPSADHVFVLRESGLREPGFSVVRDSAAWRAQWGLIVGRYTPAARTPDVDCRHAAVLVAALGFTSPMAARYPTFVEAVERGDTLVATLEVSNCAKFNDGADYPVALALIPSHPGPVVFVTRHKASRTCPM